MGNKDFEKLWAHRLYVKGGVNASVIAKKINVTEKTLSKWVNSDGWKAEREQYEKQKKESNIGDLRAFLHEKHPKLISKIDTAILDYLLQ